MGGFFFVCLFLCACDWLTTLGRRTRPCRSQAAACYRCGGFVHASPASKDPMETRSLLALLATAGGASRISESSAVATPAAKPA